MSDSLEGSMTPEDRRDLLYISAIAHQEEFLRRLDDWNKNNALLKKLLDG